MTNKQQVYLRRLVNFFKALGVLSDANLETLEENLTKEAQLGDDSTNISEAENFRNDRRASFNSQALFRLNDDVNLTRSRRIVSVENDYTALKLQKLKELILDQAKELKKQKLSLDEKDRELHRLFAENEELRNEILHLTEKITSDVSRYSVNGDCTRKRRKCSTEGVKETFEITRLSPTSSKIRRVRVASHKNQRSPEDIITPDANASDYSEAPIITPSWRFLPFNQAVVLEGTEDITDDMFTRRHNRLQAEEKRLIRRDRMRERYLEFYRKKSTSELTDDSKGDNDEPLVEAIFISGKVQKSSTLPPKKNIPRLRSSSKRLSRSSRIRRN